MVNRRRPIELLPGINQTDTLTKFFAATVDHLFQPESVEFLSAYIGSKPAYYDSKKDYYIGEIDKDRTDYQLTETAVSNNRNSGNLTNMMFYSDYVNLLKFYGANVDNHSRLFANHYYSWCPPIDVDKVLNYVKYYWLPSGPSPIILLADTNAAVDILGKTTYTYTGPYRLTSTGQTKNGSLTFSTGLVIQFARDANQQYNNISWIVDGVGRLITFDPMAPVINPDWDTVGWGTLGWDGDQDNYIKDYMTVGRSPAPTNQWSVNNKWWHETIINISQTSIANITTARAARPIIDFENDLQLYSCGSNGRPYVTLVCDTLDDLLGTVVGQSSYSIDGIKLVDGYTILNIADTNTFANNKVYKVGGLDSLGVITLTQIDGDAMLGDSILCLFGSKYRNTQLHYHGTEWVHSQQRVPHVAPLFSLYDYTGNALDDPSIYPSSNFVGNSIFTYTTDPYGASDVELGFAPKLNQFGSYVFDNTLVSQKYSYLYNTARTTIPGYSWYQNNKATGSEYNNAWYRSPAESRQYRVNDFLLTTDTKTFVVDQAPDLSYSLIQPVIVVHTVNGNPTILIKDKDYKVNGRNITLTTSALAGERITIKTWSNSPPVGTDGYYELPLNLTANPNNIEVTNISQGQFFDHFLSILHNQPGYVGQVIGSNNYRDTAQIKGLGTSILQHSAPLLRPMILSSGNVTVGINSVQSNTDPMLAMQFAQREYLRFYNRLITTLINLWTRGYSLDQSPEEWISVALRQVNLGKTENSPWANSGPEGAQGAYTNSKSTEPTFVPPTAARLGVSPVYHPYVYIKEGLLWIQTHEGARIVMSFDGLSLGTISSNLTYTTNPITLTNPVAAAWLQFELDLYNSIPVRYSSPEALLYTDARKYVQGKWRTGTYSRNEFIDISMPMFDKWIINNQIDYKAHTIFDENDPFTFNYSSMIDRDGKSVPGYWKGIYRWYYDTDRPHTHPWEMLGFTQQPSWWTSEYGPAPYTRGNTHLWEDLAAGYIRQGPNSGYVSYWTRPGLLNCIPVDDQGHLLPPHEAGCVTSLPDVSAASANWVYGDGGPIESVWINSQDHAFAIAQCMYLMRPAEFIEYNWDTLISYQAFPNQKTRQFLYLQTDNRRSYTQYYVHRENPSKVTDGDYIPGVSDTTYYGSGGIQHWISEYIVSKNLNVSQYFGSVVRGIDVKLAYRAGGFISKNLYLTADSFGQIGYTSQLLPAENVKLYLYRSSATKTSFYTGVIVTQVSNGYRVTGYDGINQYFTIIPSNQQGSKTTVVVSNEKVVWYKTAAKKTDRVPYNTIYKTKQDVFDFLISLQRHQESQGWVFDAYSSDANYVFDWVQSGREFLFWSQGAWADGNFIALSPLANKAKFTQAIGSVQFISGLIGGTYPIVDKTGSSIDGVNLEVLRYDDTLTVNSINNQGIFGLRLFSTTVESAVVIDNQTAFGDTVYDPQFNLAQPRLKLFAYRTTDWNGRLDAPGYFLNQNTTDNQWDILPNFEKTSNDFRNYYNIEQPKQYSAIDPTTGNLITAGSSLAAVDVKAISDLAKHQIGYQQRDYLQSLLLEDSTEFQFYQGFIKQKGTQNALNNLMRNDSIIPITSNFAYYEEYAVRASRFGSTVLNTGIDFILPQSQFVNNPQQITVYGQQNSDRELDGVITIIPNDPLIVVPPDSSGNHKQVLFPLRSAPGSLPNDLPNSGYVQQGATTYTIGNVAALSTLYENQLSAGITMADTDTVWQISDPTKGWTVWQYNKSNVSIQGNTPSIDTGNITTINTTGVSGVVAGDIVVLTGISNISIDGTWTVQTVSSDGLSFTIPAYTYNEGGGGNLFVYRKVRFDTPAARDAGPPINGWRDGDRAWVDKSDYGVHGWTVYQYVNKQWHALLTEDYKIDASLMLGAKLYSKSKSEIRGILEYYDPAKGYIPGAAQRNIDLTSIYDPAAYSDGDTTVYPISADRAWGPEHVGKTWWDLSSVRYVDYEIGSTAYKWQNWGKIADYTSIDVYEWTQSPVSPDQWATYVSNQTSFNQFGLNYIPTGTVRNSDNPGYTKLVEYSAAGTSKIYYYFWVKNAITIPLPSGRDKTTYEIASIIRSPSANGIPWYAAIDPRNIIVGNTGDMLSGNDTVLALTYTNKPNDQNDYKQWDLYRRDDPDSLPADYYWSKMKDSLIGKDGLGNDVPDPNLSDLMKYGNLIRPRQSWFKDRLAAAAYFVRECNARISEILLVDDSNRNHWVDYFYKHEPEPAADAGAWDLRVDTVSSRDGLNGTISSGTKVLVAAGPDTGNIWVIFRYNGGNSWYALENQLYNTSNYWNFIDYYLAGSGFDSNSLVDYTVPDIISRNQYQGSNKTVRVLNRGDGRWAVYKAESSGWTTLAVQDGTIAISKSVYDGTVNTMQWGTAGFDTLGFDFYPYRELGYIIDGLKEVIFKQSDPRNPIDDANHINQIFFEMLDYCTAEQGFVDWIVKTSYITLKGFNIPLTTSSLYKPDNTDALISYVNEIKPYHAKVRQFITGRSYQDNLTIHSTDFDGGTTDWTNNYLKNPKLIRTIKSKLVFDRISSTVNGWDSLPWAVTAWDTIVENSGAADRIYKYYSPGANMIRKDDPNLIPNTDYRGTIVDGALLGYPHGWGATAWDDVAGWDGNAPTLQQYLDLYVQGGIPPHYDSYYSDGIQIAFPLSRKLQDPTSIVVWSDNKLRLYGKDYIIPNWIESLSLVTGGVGYAIGDRLQFSMNSIIPSVSLQMLLGPDATKATEITKITVTDVDSQGGITKWRIDTKGTYEIFKSGEISVAYQMWHPGNGTGARFLPSWGGDTLIFRNSPLTNTEPSAYVLYAGTTFAGAPQSDTGFITDGWKFIDPHVNENHPEELLPVRLLQSTRIDTYVAPVGGAPAAYMRIYIPDGVRTHFDLGLKPQDQSAVLVFLDGKMLSFGTGSDYVIDYQNNRAVFMAPPVGNKLSFVSLSTGGTGTGVYTASVVYPGQGYTTGDMLTLGGGQTVNFDEAQVIVTRVKASAITINQGGTGYKVGDILVLEDDTETDRSLPVELLVTSISNGAVSGVTITQAGDYRYVPSEQRYLTNGKGTNADIAVSFGVAEVQMYHGGTYTSHAPSPILQISSTGTGVGALFEALYTFTNSTNTFETDGISNSFVIDTFVPNNDVNHVMVTLDGVKLINGVNATITINGNVVTIVPAVLHALPANSIVTITCFGNTNYSTINEQDLLMLVNVGYYPLQDGPYSTLPPYLSTVVTLRRLGIEGPWLDVYKATGYHTVYKISHPSIPTIDPTLFAVYSGNYLMTLNGDYQIYDDSIIFDEPPAEGKIIAIVNLDPNFGYNYILTTEAINFQLDTPIGWDQGYWDGTRYGWSKGDDYRPPQPGDIAKVVTFSEDASYDFRTEQFIGPCWPMTPGNKPGVYVLKDQPYSDNTAIVWLDNQSQTLMQDYAIEKVDSIPGWDTTDWDVYGWNTEYRGDTSIRFAPKVGDTPGSQVQVQYMSGLPEKPAVAWRSHMSGKIAGHAESSTVISNTRETTLLGEVTVFSTTIEVADITKLYKPQNAPGAVWIGNERIVYWNLRSAPTAQHPNRGFLENLSRGTMNTPNGNVSVLFDTLFYDGDGNNVYFAAASGTEPAGGLEAVFIGKDIQVNQTIDDNKGTYTVVVNPPHLSAGRYIKFNVAPPVGWRNVKIASPRYETTTPSIISHKIGTTVIDSGPDLEIPGGYRWTAAPEGLQYSDDSVARFLLDHA
jgi:hypothetical protein